MIDAFSYAKEYWDVGLRVKASYLESRLAVTRHRENANWDADVSVPCKRYLYMVLINREPKIQELQLPIIPI